MDLPAVNVLSLCAGVGGLDRGVRLALPDARTVCFVEIEAYACEVLASRMEDEALDDAPVWTNLRTFDGRPWRGVVDLVIGGYPCQPFSVAGKRGGRSDPRHLWPEIRRILDEVRPVACFFENVPGHVSLGLRDVRCDLQELGYRVEAGLYSAAEVGASHRRQRLFILAVREAVADDDGAKLRIESWRRSWQNGAGASVAGDASEGVADPECPQRRAGELAGRGDLEGADREGQTAGIARSVGALLDDDDDDDDDGCQGERRGRLLDGERSPCGYDADGRSGSVAARQFPPGPDEMSLWADVPESAQPSICRLADGLADRVDRLRAAGNGVVPQCAAYAFRLLLDRHRDAVKEVA